MIDAVIVEPGGTTGEPSVSGISWAAVVAGAVASCAITLMVLALGIGLGLSVVSPWGGEGVSATSFKVGSGLYLIVVAMLSSSVGGYLAGRLRSRFGGLHTDEVYFRDTAHGFVAWALATVLGAILLATPASHLIGGAAQGMTQATATNAAASGPMDRYVDMLLRTERPGATANGSAAETHAELARLLTFSFRHGSDLNPADQAYVSRIVAARTGLSQADADKRVNDVVTQIRSDLDAARRAAAQLAFWLTASLLLGAFCASLAATEGGELRDRAWGLTGRRQPAAA
jgi:hypothetical protein